jgi:hypothetical protein
LSGHTIHFKFSPLLTKKGYEKEGIRPLVCFALFCFANSFLSSLVLSSLLLFIPYMPSSRIALAMKA